jgi:hypothetical protein
MTAGATCIFQLSDLRLSHVLVTGGDLAYVLLLPCIISPRSHPGDFVIKRRYLHKLGFLVCVGPECYVALFRFRLTLHDDPDRCMDYAVFDTIDRSRPCSRFSYSSLFGCASTSWAITLLRDPLSLSLAVSRLMKALPYRAFYLSTSLSKADYVPFSPRHNRDHRPLLGGSSQEGCLPFNCLGSFNIIGTVCGTCDASQSLHGQ